MRIDGANHPPLNPQTELDRVRPSTLNNAAVRQAVDGFVPSAPSGAGILGIGLGDVSKLGQALGHVMKASKALQQQPPDWHGALDEVKAAAQVAPGSVGQFSRQLIEKAPQEIKRELAKLNISEKDVQQLRAALPHALDAARSLSRGDWKGALQDFGAIGKAAPDVAKRLGDYALSRAPQPVKDALHQIELHKQDLRELGAALPRIVDAAHALSNGDWQGALAGLEAAGQAAPGLSRQLGKAIADRLPQGLKDEVAKLGLDKQDLHELGAALPQVLNAARSLGNGDLQGTVDALKAAGQAAPHLSDKLGKAIADHLPQGLKDRLGQLGVAVKDLRQAGAAVPHLLDAAHALERGDWKGAVDQLRAVKEAAPDVVEKLGNAVSKILPDSVKQTLGQFGVAADKLGKALPDAIRLTDALQRGNPREAFEALDTVLGDINPNMKGKLAEAAGKALGVSPQIAGALLRGEKVSIADLHSSRVIGQLPSSVTGKNPKIGQLESTAKDVTLAQGGFNVGGSLYSAQGSWGKPGDKLYASGQVNFGQAVLKGEGSVSGNLKDLTLSAQGRLQAGIYAVNANGQIQANYGWGSTAAQGHAMVGAQGIAEGQLKLDPRHGTVAARVHGDAFAGAEAGVSLQQNVGPIGANGGVEVEAGIGVHFGLDVGFQKGKFSYQMDIGAALGIGIELKLGFSVDFAGIAKTAWGALKGVGKAAGEVLKGAGRAVEWVGKAAGKAVSAVADGAKKVVNAVGDAVGGAAKAVGNVAKKIFSGW